MDIRFLAATLLSALSCLASAHAAPVGCSSTPGAIIDPSGDETTFATDLVCANVVREGDGLRFLAGYNPDDFDPSLSSVIFSLDLDGNTDTGAAGIDTGNSDAEFIGLDAIVTLTPFGAGEVVIGIFSGEGRFLGRDFTGITTEVFDDGLSALVPLARFSLSVLPPISGLVFKAVAVRELPGTGGTTPIGDYASDVGLPPGPSTTEIPIPPAIFLMGAAILGFVPFGPRCAA